jgi:hypothetical protein
MALQSSGNISLSQIAQYGFSNTQSHTTPYGMSTFVKLPLVLTGGSNAYIASGALVNLGKYYGATRPTGFNKGPSLSLITRVLNFYNIGWGTNTNKWYDYGAVYAKYGIGIWIYFFYAGGVYRIMFNGSESGQLRNTHFQYYDTTFGWVTASGAQLPSWSGGWAPSASTVLTVTEIEDIKLLSGISLTTSNIGCMYSIRLLRREWTGAVVNVRRGSDNVTADFYPADVGPLLTNGSNQELSKWLNGATGYVVAWYDQSGNGNNATQSTAASQPTIVLESISGLYCIYFSGGDVGSNYQGFVLNSGVQTLGIHCQYQFQSNSSTWQSIVCTGTNDNQGLRLWGNKFSVGATGDVNDYANNTAGTGAVIYQNGSTYTNETLAENVWHHTLATRTNGASTYTMTRIGRPVNYANRTFKGYMSELVLFTSTPTSSDAALFYSQRRIK